jgi:hypothetical protein
MMYALICLTLFLGVYWAPALAFFPRLILHPVTAVLMPLLSIGIVMVETGLLEWGGLFQPYYVIVLTGVTGVVAVVRGMQLRGQGFWTPWYWRILVFQVALFLPYAVKIGLQAFDSDDEIYSWNFWALQHVWHEPISYEHTGAPYPQGLPRFLAYQYQLLGNIEWQLPIKAGLILIPFCLFTSIAFAGLNRVGQQAQRATFYVIASFMLSVWVIFVINWQQYFDYGYADPLMAAFGVASVACWIHAKEKTTSESQGLFLLSAFFALCGVLTKQAALVWGIALPLLLGWEAYKTRRFFYGLLAIGVLGSIGLWWGLEGLGFTTNTGVIGASTEGRERVLAQLWVAVKRYWIFMPQLLLLYGVAAWISFKKWPLIWVMFIVPATLLWFLFGAYHLRLGIHIIGVLALLIAFYWTELKMLSESYLPVMPDKWAKGPRRCGIQSECQSFRLDASLRWHDTLIWPLIFTFSLIGCTISYYRSPFSKETGLSVYQASSVSFKKYFGLDSAWVLSTLYDKPNVVLFVPATYIAGLFYGHTPMVRPRYADYTTYTETALLADFDVLKPHYVFTSGALKQGEPANTLIEQLAQKRPDLLTPVAVSPNRYGYKIYRLVVTPAQATVTPA